VEQEWRSIVLEGGISKKMGVHSEEERGQENEAESESTEQLPPIGAKECPSEKEAEGGCRPGIKQDNSGRGQALQTQRSGGHGAKALQGAAESIEGQRGGKVTKVPSQVDDLLDVIHIHPALSELVRNAAREARDQLVAEVGADQFPLELLWR
jgi:hypothetical protein